MKVVYVKGISEEMSEADIRAVFEKYGEVTRVILPVARPGQPKRDFGFVHFAERADALKAIDKGEKIEVDGALLRCSCAPILVSSRHAHRLVFVGGCLKDC